MPLILTLELQPLIQFSMSAYGEEIRFVEHFYPQIIPSPLHIAVALPLFVLLPSP